MKKGEMAPTEFNFRITELMKEGEGPFAWANKRNLPGGTFSRIWNEGAEPNLKVALKISEYDQVTLDWLLTGRLPKWQFERGLREAAAEKEAEFGFKKVKEDFVFLPRYNASVSAGQGANIESEQIVDYLAFKTKWISDMGLQRDRLALVTALGDSMEPTIYDETLLLVDLREEFPRSDGIYIIRRDSELIAKRVQLMLSGGIKIKSDNPRYEEEMLTSNEARAQLTVIGRAVWGGGRL